MLKGELHTYCVQFTYKNGNGWAIVNATSPKAAESIFLVQTKYPGAKVTSMKEQRYFGEEQQLVYEGDVSTFSIETKAGFPVEVLQGDKGEKGDKGDIGTPGKDGQDYYYNRIHAEPYREYRTGDKGKQVSVGPGLDFSIDSLEENEVCLLYFKDKVKVDSMNGHSNFKKKWRWTRLPISINAAGQIFYNDSIYEPDNHVWNTLKERDYWWLFDYINEWISERTSQQGNTITRPVINAESVIELCKRFNTKSPIRSVGNAYKKADRTVAIFSILLGKHNGQAELRLTVSSTSTSNKFRYQITNMGEYNKFKSESLDIKFQIVELNESNRVVKRKEHATLKIIYHPTSIRDIPLNTVWYDIVGDRTQFPKYSDIADFLAENAKTGSGFPAVVDNLKQFSIIKIKDPILV